MGRRSRRLGHNAVSAMIVYNTDSVERLIKNTHVITCNLIVQTRDIKPHHVYNYIKVHCPLTWTILAPGRAAAV